MEKLNKSERKGLSELIPINQGEETAGFWKDLGGKPADFQLANHVPDGFTPPKSILYKVDLGQEFIELPQGQSISCGLSYGKESSPSNATFLVELEPGGVLKKELLNTRNIYILDCFTELFVW